MAKDSRLKRAGVSGYNKPKRTPGHKTRSHIVVANLLAVYPQPISSICQLLFFCKIS